MRAGYHQIPLDPRTADRTAFSTESGHYAFNVLCFGLKGAPHTYTAVLSTILRGLQYKFCLAYIDDILCWSQNIDQHLSHLGMIFERVRDSGMKFHPKKCCFGLRKVKYLGHVISNLGIHADEEKVHAMTSFPRPTNVKTLRSFLGLIGYYKKFIRSYAEMAYPLFQLLRKNTMFSWSEECENAFIALKTALTSFPVLRFADFDKDFVLTTDASRRSLGYLIEQPDANGELRPILFGGRAVQKSESSYTISELECLAIVVACQENHAFFSARPFKIITDHLSLKYLNSLKLKAGRLLRWSILLSQYSFTVEYRKGSENEGADALSRRDYEPTEPQTQIDDNLDDMLFNLDRPDEGEQPSQSPAMSDPFAYHDRVRQTFLIDFTSKKKGGLSAAAAAAVAKAAAAATDRDDLIIAAVNETNDLVHSSDRLIDAQKACPELSPMINYLIAGALPEDDKIARKILLTCDNFVMIQNKLHHIFRPSRGVRETLPIIEQLCVPNSLKREILSSYHDSNLHLGVERLYETIRRKYYWSGLYADCYLYATDCVECQQVKKSTRTLKSPLNPLETGDIFDTVHIDVLGSLPLSEPDNFRFILTVIDGTSKWPELFPLKNQTASEICECLFQYVARHGAMRRIISDCAANLTGAIATAFAKIFNIKQVHISVFSQQTNSTCEVFNKMILQAFRLNCSEKQSSWPLYINPLLMSSRSCVGVNSTKFSPAELIFGGRKLNFFVDHDFLAKQDLPRNVESYVQDMIPRLKLFQEQVKLNVAGSKMTAKKFHDRNATDHTLVFKLGARVWRLVQNKRVGFNPKLSPRWYGPFFIVGFGEYPNSYKLRHAISDKPVKFTVNGEHLKLCIDHSEDLAMRGLNGNARNEPIKLPTEQRGGGQRIGIKTPNAMNKPRILTPTGMIDGKIIAPSNKSEGVINPSTVITPARVEQGLTWAPVNRILRRSGDRIVKFLVLFEDGVARWVDSCNISERVKQDYYESNRPRTRASGRAQQNNH